LTVAAPYHGDVVTATDGSATGSSIAFNVVGPLDHFNVTLSTAAVSVGVPITVYATAVDALNDALPGYSTALTISDAAGLGTFGAVTWSSGGTAKFSATFSGPFTADTVTVTGAGTSGTSRTFTIR
jgi:hypothetical protein